MLLVRNAAVTGKRDDVSKSVRVRCFRQAKGFTYDHCTQSEPNIVGLHDNRRIRFYVFPEARGIRNVGYGDEFGEMDLRGNIWN